MDPLVSEMLKSLKKHVKTSYLKNDCGLSNWTSEHKKQFFELASNPSLRICSTDKNLGPIVVQTTLYNTETKKHINAVDFDELSITEVNTSLEQFVNKCTVIFYRRSAEISCEEFDFISQYFPAETSDFSTVKFPVPYLLWKIHKNPIASRMIVPAPGYIVTPLSTWLHSLLDPIVKSITLIAKDSTSIIQDLEVEYFNSDCCLSCMDVTALYPSIPLDIGIGIVGKVLTLKTNYSSSKITAILDLLSLVLKTNIVKYDNKYYRQKVGTAMGTPIAVCFAQLFMFGLEYELVQRYKDADLLLYYKRYIDDILCIFVCKEAARTFWIQFNQLNCAIQVTGDTAAPAVHYLDLTLRCDLGSPDRLQKIFYSCFQKPLNSYLYLPFHSFHRDSSKSGFIKGELIRYSVKCKSFHDYLIIRKAFFQRLLSRGYTYAFLKKSFDQVHFDQRTKYVTVSSEDDHDSSDTKSSDVLVLANNTAVHSLRLNQFFKVNWTRSASLATDFNPLIAYKNPNSLKRIIALNAKKSETPLA